ncbi:MAG TPA: response regulator [Rectinemataceae bacterium]|nr:response regulator [Rectinemataceae bacterium]
MILIVDDDPMAAAISQAILEAAGLATIIAESASEARAILAANASIALVVSDHHMPGTSGIELFGILAAAGSRKPFVLLSGDDPESLKKLAPGIDICLAKDESLGERLPTAIERLLGDDIGGSRIA